MLINQYFDLLTRYFEMIWTEPWWDGRRELLVQQMETMWPTLDEDQQNAAIEYNNKLYREFSSQFLKKI